MPGSTRIVDYIGRGIHDDRPDPPPIGPGTTAIYYETDTNTAFVWDGSVWQGFSLVGSSGVTNVDLVMPSELLVAGGPVTTTGTFTVTWDDEVGNVVLASPSDGSSGPPSFRSLVAADLPSAPVPYNIVVMTDNLTLASGHTFVRTNFSGTKTLTFPLASLNAGLAILLTHIGGGTLNFAAQGGEDASYIGISEESHWISDGTKWYEIDL